MQSACVLIQPEFASQVVDARAVLSEDPVIGSIYDPPFVHFTIQLAEEYDWAGLERALDSFAAEWEPFELVTSGLQVFTGAETGIAVAPRKDRRLLEFHAAAWEVITPFAQGRVNPFYHPDSWVPHITIKRSGSDPRRFGDAMAKLAATNFTWTTSVSNIAVQHDPGKNSLTHYLRLRFPLGRQDSQPTRTDDALTPVIEQLEESSNNEGTKSWTARIWSEDGSTFTEEWDAPTMVRLMAAAQASSVYFAGARCRTENGRVTAIVPNTPHPIAQQ